MNNNVIGKIDFVNEAVLKYETGSNERIELERELANMKNSFIEIPVIIGEKEILTGNKGTCFLPHNKSKIIGEYHKASEKEVEMAIEEALKAKEKWESLAWESRASIFLRAAELVTGPWRAKINAATMLIQSKTYKQAEIDAACELADFFRFNAACLPQIYNEQPMSLKNMWNKMEYRPIEGFIYAVSPFNFTSIAGNLPGAPAITGNVVLWKPASAAVYTAYIIYQILKEAGLPDGVINFIPGNAGEVSEIILKNKHLSGIHFTGSTKVFQDMWTAIGNNITNYKTFPRLVGETGGKDFIIVHNSANLESASQGIIDGSFEYQGQKCSAASRIYIAKSIWSSMKKIIIEKAAKIKVGDVERIDTFMGAVIDQKSFDNIKNYIDYAKISNEAEIIFGGNCDNSIGFFVEPTIILANDPHFKTMEEEIFGPVLTIYVYDDDKFDEVLALIDSTSGYALTGAIFARDRYAIDKAESVLVNAAGNFYINDKPTGAVVGQQPFGGSRLSGTNDKAGSKFNLMRWISPRVIKETL
jgi:1-pyrroline-5-carboxylate dehydrogenase